jgi:hypothetical protein
MLKRFLTTVLFLGFAYFSDGPNARYAGQKAKTDTVVKKVDTVKALHSRPKLKKSRYTIRIVPIAPSLAVRRSLFIPGWGQVL